MSAKVHRLPVHGKETLFDLSPLHVGGFEFRSRSAVPMGKTVKITDWQEAFVFAGAAEESSPFWVGDLVVYAEGRKDWKDKLDQAMSVTKLARHTIQNRASVSRKVTGVARDLAPSLSHAAVVTDLEPKEQEELLSAARTEEWTVSELSKAKKDRARRVVSSGRADDMHTVEVTIRVSVEAKMPYEAETKAWAIVKDGLKQGNVPHAHVVGAHVVGGLREVKAG